jgi:hypothetical protein
MTHHLTSPPPVVPSGTLAADQLSPGVRVLGESLQLSPHLAHLLGVCIVNVTIVYILCYSVNRCMVQEMTATMVT